MDKARVMEPISGTKLYQERARAALPLLVRQAEAGSPITYGNLASELDMSNPRNLNHVLLSIGEALERLSDYWKENVPPLQCLVVNKVGGLPGKGIGESSRKLAKYGRLSKQLRKELIRDLTTDVCTYQKWTQVLNFFDLKRTVSDFTQLNKKASAGTRGGGESKEHQRLKEYILAHPEALGLPTAMSSGMCEHELPSGDRIDVFFEHEKTHIGVEVKPVASDEADLTRGIYQCVKYQAVLEARQAACGQFPNVRVVLAIGGRLPRELVALKNILAVEVLEEVGTK